MVFLAVLVKQTVHSVCLGCRDPTKDGRGNAEAGSRVWRESPDLALLCQSFLEVILYNTKAVVHFLLPDFFFHVSAVVMLYSILC